jgi:hypothetical protein
MSTDMTSRTNRELEPQSRTLTTADMAAAARNPTSPRPRNSERDGDAVRDPADRADLETIRDPEETADREPIGDRDEPRERGRIGSGQSTPKNTAGAAGHDEQLAPLFTPDTAGDYRSRWDIVQRGFVDDPRQAVRLGDELVAQVMQNLAETFSRERAALESRMDQPDSASTETLRITLRRYRSFFERLLSI